MLFNNIYLNSNTCLTIKQMNNKNEYISIKHVFFSKEMTCSLCRQNVSKHDFVNHTVIPRATIAIYYIFNILFPHVIAGYCNITLAL